MKRRGIRRDLTYSIIEGVYANVFTTLTGGVFLTGFALFVGMSDFMIGLLAATPSLVTIFQLPVSYFTEKGENRKRIAIFAASAARLLWIPITFFGVIPYSPRHIVPTLIFVLIFLSFTFATINYVAWFTWISELVPQRLRGRFFGTRNMLCGAAAMITMVVFGKLLDVFAHHHLLPFGFACTFLCAVVFGVFSLRYLSRIAEPEQAASEPFVVNVRWVWRPLKDSNFRRFILFAFTWSFSVYFASPFFTLYFLRDLRFGYGFVATLSMISSFADLVGMRVWGRISDLVKNKAIIQLSSWVVVFLPFAWAMVRPGSIVVPIILQLVGGGFWAGINLCTNNLLLAISPPKRRSLYLSLYNVASGLGAIVGPLSAGLLLNAIRDLELSFFSLAVLPLQIVFLSSTLFRLASRHLIDAVKEPTGRSTSDVLRILKGLRWLNMTSGFNYLLHPFIEIARGAQKGVKRPSFHDSG